MQHRSNARRAQRDEFADLALATEAGPDEHVHRLQTQRALCEQLLELAEPYRRTLVLHYYYGLSLADIARQDGRVTGVRAGGEGEWSVAIIATLSRPSAAQRSRKT